MKFYYQSPQDLLEQLITDRAVAVEQLLLSVATLETHIEALYYEGLRNAS